MWSAVSTVFFLVMAPLGLMAAEEVQTSIQQTSNAPGAVEVEAQHVQKYLREGGGHAREQEHRSLISDKMSTLLDMHNEVRCLHNADPLTYKNKIAKSAQVHADALAKSCGGLYHSPNQDRPGYGENLYSCTGKTGSASGSGNCITAQGAMRRLYEDEVTVFRVNYGGHATQILWKSTTELGCAEATCNKDTKKTAYLVCQYNPIGNVDLDKNLRSEVGLPTGRRNC